jgi:hypothetical protein
VVCKDTSLGKRLAVSVMIELLSDLDERLYGFIVLECIQELKSGNKAMIANPGRAITYIYASRRPDDEC